MFLKILILIKRLCSIRVIKLISYSLNFQSGRLEQSRKRLTKRAPDLVVGRAKKRIQANAFVRFVSWFSHQAGNASR